jgi:hypothetical protein
MHEAGHGKFAMAVSKLDSDGDYVDDAGSLKLTHGLGMLRDIFLFS